MIQNFDPKKMSNVVVADVDYKDYPDFSDAWIEEADYDGRELTIEELDWISDNYPEIMAELIYNSLL